MEARARTRSIAPPPTRPPRPPRLARIPPGPTGQAPCSLLITHPYRDPIQVQHEIVAVNRQEVNDHGTAVAAMDKATRWVGHGS
eukprot:scaffold63186_cov55-Phaeocystis_antarctica.AAC.3